MHTQRAKTLANGFNNVGGDTDICHIYDDGFVILLACTSDVHLDARHKLARDFADCIVEEARSDDGFLSVFIVPRPTPEKRLPVEELRLACIPGLTSGFHDHREEHQRTIEQAVRLLERVTGPLSVRVVKE